MLHTHLKFPAPNHVPTDPTPLCITCLIMDTLLGTPVKYLFKHTGDFTVAKACAKSLRGFIWCSAAQVHQISSIDSLYGEGSA